MRKWQMDVTAVRRQIVNLIQEFCEHFSLPALGWVHQLYPKLYILELCNPLEYDFYGLLMEVKFGEKNGWSSWDSILLEI